MTLFTRLIVTVIFPHTWNCRKLRHPHIVECFGTAFRNVPRGVEAAFVTERPAVTLKSHLVDDPGNNPSENNMLVVNVIRWAHQIINALIAVHNLFQGCVHGDLRLENVLVSPLHVQQRLMFQFFMFSISLQKYTQCICDLNKFRNITFAGIFTFFRQ